MNDDELRQTTSSFGRIQRLRASSHQEPPPERHDYDRIPDVRDGLTRVERVVLHVMWTTQKELGDRNVPSAMLYGRVVEHVNISVAEFQTVLRRLVGRG